MGLHNPGWAWFAAGVAMHRVPCRAMCYGFLLAIACGAAHAGIVIDTLPVNGEGETFNPVFSNWGRGLTFTTGNAAGTHITDLKIAVDGSAYDVTGSFSFTAGLYAASGGLPTGSLLASTTFNVVGFSGKNVLSPATLGTLGTYSLAAGTQYSLTVFNATTNGYFLGGNFASTGTTSDGYVVNNGLFTTNVSSWSTDSTVTALQLSVVPEPTTWWMATCGAACAAWKASRRRKRNGR